MTRGRGSQQRTTIGNLLVGLLLLSSGLLTGGVCVWATSDMPQALDRKHALDTHSVTKVSGTLTGEHWSSKTGGGWVWHVKAPGEDPPAMAGGSDDDLLKDTQGEPVTAWVHKDETLAIRLPDGRIVYGDDTGWEGVLFAVLAVAMNWAVGPAFVTAALAVTKIRPRPRLPTVYLGFGVFPAAGLTWAHVTDLPNMLRVDMVVLPALVAFGLVGYGLVRLRRWSRTRRARQAV